VETGREVRIVDRWLVAMNCRTIASWAGFVMLATTTARAQSTPSSADVERSKELFAAGRRLVDAGNCEEGVRKLQESLRYNESIGVRLSLAECAKDRPLDAWRQLKMAEHLAAKKGDARAAYASSQAALLEPSLALIRVELAPSLGDLAGFELHIDHAPVDPYLWRGGTIAVEPGSRVVETSARGKRGWTRDVEAKVGVVVSVNVAVGDDADDGGAVPGATHPRPREERGANDPGPRRERGLDTRTVGIAVAGVGVAVVAVGAFAGLSALSNMQDSKDSHCGAAAGQTDPNRCTPVGLDLRDRARWQADLSTGLFVIGGLAVVTGAVLVVAPLLRGRAASERPTTTRGVRAVAGPGSVMLMGSF
jgi:hypothetical protein